MIRRYSNLIQHHSFEDRFKYLRLQGSIGRDTFGFDRHVNQRFYRSREWKNIRDFVIVRDEGCDLGVEGYEINHELLVHHMNPMVMEDIVHGNEDILNPEYLITTTHDTHNAIHYGVSDIAPNQLVKRQPGDTKLW